MEEEPGGLYSPWGHIESDMTWRLNNNKIFTSRQDRALG